MADLNKRFKQTAAAKTPPNVEAKAEVVDAAPVEVEALAVSAELPSEVEVIDAAPEAPAELPTERVLIFNAHIQHGSESGKKLEFLPGERVRDLSKAEIDAFISKGLIKEVEL